MYDTYLLTYLLVNLVSDADEVVRRCCCSSHILTSDIDISQTARAAKLFLSDGVIITGAETGSAVNTAALKGQSKAYSDVVAILCIDRVDSAVSYYYRAMH